MITLDGDTAKATIEHRAKLAYVYVRQSSVSQVTRHTESTDLQYQLVERAVRLGWPRARVQTGGRLRHRKHSVIIVDKICAEIWKKGAAPHVVTSSSAS